MGRAMLEGIFERKLNMPFHRTSARDLAEAGIRDEVVRVAVACSVEGVEEVCPEVQAIFTPDRERFLHCHVDVIEAGRAKRARADIAESITRLLAEGADPVICVGATSFDAG